MKVEWQSVETAPKDGSQFLGLLSNGWYELVRFNLATADYAYQWWRTLNTTVPVIETHPGYTGIHITHWMPLPKPPEQSS